MHVRFVDATKRLALLKQVPTLQFPTWGRGLTATEFETASFQQMAIAQPTKQFVFVVVDEEELNLPEEEVDFSNKRVVATLRVYPRNAFIKHDDGSVEDVPSIMLSGLLTDPTLRKQGLGSQMFQKVLEYYTGSDRPLVFLWSGVEKWYQKFGCSYWDDMVYSWEPAKQEDDDEDAYLERYQAKGLKMFRYTDFPYVKRLAERDMEVVRKEMKPNTMVLENDSFVFINSWDRTRIKSAGLEPRFMGAEFVGDYEGMEEYSECPPFIVWANEFHTETMVVCRFRYNNNLQVLSTLLEVARNEAGHMGQKLLNIYDFPTDLKSEISADVLQSLPGFVKMEPRVKHQTACIDLRLGSQRPSFDWKLREYYGYA